MLHLFWVSTDVCLVAHLNPVEGSQVWLCLAPWRRLDKPELCSRPVTFNSIVDKLQLSDMQLTEMLAVRKTWRDFLGGYACDCVFALGQVLVSSICIMHVCSNLPALCCPVPKP